MNEGQGNTNGGNGVTGGVYNSNAGFGTFGDGSTSGGLAKGALAVSPVTGGDIYLGGDSRKKGGRWKWWVIGGGIIVIFGVIVILLFGVLRGTPAEEVKATLEANYDSIAQLEEIYSNIYEGELSYEDVYASSDSVDILENLTSSLKELQSDIYDVEEVRGVPLAKTGLKGLKKIISERLPVYEDGARIYKIFYGVYHADNPLSAAEELMNDEEEAIATTAGEFYRYYDNNNRILANMADAGCETWFVAVDKCPALYEEYEENNSFIDDGQYLKNAFMRMSGKIDYEEFGKITDIIDEIIYYIDGGKEE